MTSVQKLDKEIDKMPATAKKAETGMKNLWLQVGVGIAAAQGVIRGLKSMVRFMGDVIDKAKIQEDAENDLAAALRTTGRDVDKLLPSLKEYAGELQKQTRYGDEATMQAMALIAQMTELDEKGLKRATVGTLGLASVMKTDLKSAAALVQKALGGNIGALSRYGIKVDKNLSDSEKQASLLEQLEVLYKRAQAETDTFAGKTAQLSNIWGDLKEVLGKAFIENEKILELIDNLKSSVTDFIDSGKALKLGEDLGNSLTIIIQTGKVAVDTIYNLRAGLISLADSQSELVMKGLGFEGHQERIARLMLEGKREVQDFIREMDNLDLSLSEVKEEIMKGEEHWENWKEQMRETNKMIGGATIIIKTFTDAWNQYKEEQEGATEAGSEFTYVAQTLNTEVPELSDNLKELVESAYPVKDVFDDGAVAMEDFGQAGEDAVQQVVDAMLNQSPILQEQMTILITSWEGNLYAFSDAAKQVWDEILDYAIPTVMGIDKIFNQMHINEMIRIDNEQKRRQSAIDQWYQAEYDAIMNNIEDEEERQQALEALEEERAAKETALQEEIDRKATEAKRAQAKRDKAVALMQAIVNTGSAVVEALPNLVLAGIVAALGAAQVAAIQAQPLPLAKGGILERPTFLAGEAGREAVIPLDSYRGKEILKETFKTTNTPIYLTVQNKIDEDWFRKKVTKIVEDESRLGRLRIASKAVV